MALPYDPNFTMAVSLERIDTDGAPEHDASVSAAIVAAELISSARLARKLDSVHTEYSAQYLVDKVPRKKQGGRDLKLTVKDCLEFALKEGIPKEDRWPHLGSGIKLPSSFQPALVSMKGEVVEAKSIEEACDLLTDQPVGAKLHMFSPQFDLQQDGGYCGVSGEPSSYVGLRDGIIVKVERIQGKSIATVKLWYKNKFQSVKVATSRWFSFASPKNINPGAPVPPFLLVDPGAIEPTYLLVDFCVPRLSIN